MHDLKLAKKRLRGKDLALSVVKNNKVIFESSSHGISSFLEAIGKLEDKLEGASVGDKVAGKAIGLLCVYAGISAIYAVTLSEEGRTVFEKYSVYHEWENLVKSILDVDKVEICPFEKAVIDIFDPVQAYDRLKALRLSFSR